MKMLETRLRKLEEWADTLPARADYSHLTDAELNRRILEFVTERFGSWDAFLDSGKSVSNVPAWPENGDLSPFNLQQIAAMILHKLRT